MIELRNVAILLQKGQEQLQRGKKYYKIEQLIHYKVGQSLSRGACITKKSALLQSGTGVTDWG